MNKQYLPFFILPLFLLSMCTLMHHRNDKSLLWRVSGNGLNEPSYIFGTIPSVCGEDLFWTQKIKQSLEASKFVCFEKDPYFLSLREEYDDQVFYDHKYFEALKSMNEQIKNLDGKKPKDYFTPKEYDEVKKYFNEIFNLDIEKTTDYTYLPLTLIAIETRKLHQCTATISYDKQFFVFAHNFHKQLSFLEVTNADSLGGALIQKEEEKAAKELVKEAEGNDSTSQLYGQLLNAYKKQDLPALHEIIKRIPYLTGNEDDSEQNKNWQPLIIEKMQQGSIFFVLNAGHLLGSNGIINQLQKAGYTVSPVIDYKNIVPSPAYKPEYFKMP